MESVEADAKLGPVGTDKRHSSEQAEDGTDGVEDSRVLEAETNVYRVMTSAAVCGGVVVREEVTMVCSSLGVVVGGGGGGEGGETERKLKGRDTGYDFQMDLYFLALSSPECIITVGHWTLPHKYCTHG